MDTKYTYCVWWTAVFEMVRLVITRFNLNRWFHGDYVLEQVVIYWIKINWCLQYITDVSWAMTNFVKCVHQTEIYQMRLYTLIVQTFIADFNFTLYIKMCTNSASLSYSYVALWSLHPFLSRRHKVLQHSHVVSTEPIKMCVIKRFGGFLLLWRHSS